MPSGLKYLLVGNKFEQSLKNLPIGVKSLAIQTNKQPESLENLPDNLEILYLDCLEYDKPITVIPRNLKICKIKCKSNYLDTLDNWINNIKLNYPKTKFCIEDNDY